MKELILVIGPALPEAARPVHRARLRPRRQGRKRKRQRAAPKGCCPLGRVGSARGRNFALCPVCATSLRGKPRRAHGLGARHGAHARGRLRSAALAQRRRQAFHVVVLIAVRAPPQDDPSLYTVYKLRAVERLMDEGGFAALRVFGGDANLRATLANMCGAGHRQFTENCDAPIPPAPAKSLLRKIFRRAPTLRSLARYAHWWWTVRRHMPPVLARCAAAHRRTGSHCHLLSQH